MGRCNGEAAHMDIWRAESQCIKFLIQAVYDILLSPSNVQLWGKSDSPSSPLLSEVDTQTRLQQLPKGTRGWPLPLVPSPGAEGSCWQHLLSDKSKQSKSHGHLETK